MVVRIAYPDVIRVGVSINPPARRGQILATMNNVYDSLRIRRKTVCSQNLRLKAEVAPDEAQSDIPPIILGL